VGYLLVTNDDGVDSPALLPLVHALREIAPVRVVVPDRERSWIGKAISRWEDLSVKTLRRDDVEIVAVGGYPADCTNLGVHSLFGERPEMVVSGINIGLNIGLGFFLSSGTVGAAMEGWITGVPSIAFSTGLPDNDRAWKQDALGPASSVLWERAAKLSAQIVADVRVRGYPEGVDLLSVNFPTNADASTPRVVTELAAIGYGRLFHRRDGDVFVHDFDGAFRNEEAVGPHTDVAIVRAGKVSITPVRLAHTARVDADLRAGLERGP
jgi:5'-nucleotidase